MARVTTVYRFTTSEWSIHLGNLRWSAVRKNLAWMTHEIHGELRALQGAFDSVEYPDTDSEYSPSGSAWNLVKYGG